MSVADSAEPLSRIEAGRLFRALQDSGPYVLAVSGGPDSTALLTLAAQWAEDAKASTRLVAVTVDHQLRPEAAQEAEVVGRLAARFGVEHRTLRWDGTKPKTGLQEAARRARYRILQSVATDIGARHILTAHTLDDQAETVLMRLCRGSGISGLRGMEIVAPVPDVGPEGGLLVRPFLETAKARLVATLHARGIPYVSDPSNSDPRFTRVRLRSLMATLEGEGLSAERLVNLAKRASRVDDAMVHYLGIAAAAVTPRRWGTAERLTLAGETFISVPEEISLRLLDQMIAAAGNEGPVELGKLENLICALRPALEEALNRGAPAGRFRRTLAGAVVALAGTDIVVERAPARRTQPSADAVLLP